MRATLGFTFIELTICLAIVVITCGLAAPAISHALERSRASSAINSLATVIVFARYSAVLEQTTVTLCPSRSGTTCGGDWNKTIIVFTDTNQDRQVNGKDRVLRQLSLPLEGGSIRWRAFQNRQYLQMISSGYTNFQNGNFTYCPASGDERFARQLIINLQGRPRSARDRDHDGIVEDSKGRAISC